MNVAEVAVSRNVEAGVFLPDAIISLQLVVRLLVGLGMFFIVMRRLSFFRSETVPVFITAGLGAGPQRPVSLHFTRQQRFIVAYGLVLCWPM